MAEIIVKITSTGAIEIDPQNGLYGLWPGDKVQFVAQREDPVVLCVSHGSIFVAESKKGTWGGRRFLIPTQGHKTLTVGERSAKELAKGYGFTLSFILDDPQASCGGEVGGKYGGEVGGKFAASRRKAKKASAGP